MQYYIFLAIQGKINSQKSLHSSTDGISGYGHVSSLYEFCFLFIHMCKVTGIGIFFVCVSLEKKWHRVVKDYYFLTVEKHFFKYNDGEINFNIIPK